VTEANNPNNALLEQGTWMPFIKNHPVFNTSFYGQYISPKFFNKKLQVTASLRYDNESYQYSSVDSTSGPSGSRTFQHLSPRFAIVYLPNDKFSFKGMVENSFRMPEPYELFCYSNTWMTDDFNPNHLDQPNVRNLLPEYLTTYELQGTWQMDKNISFKTNLFQENFENQILYNAWYANTLSFTDVGFESELNANFENLNLFLNYMYVKRTHVTLILSFNSQYRGPAERNPGDQQDPNIGSLSVYRPDVVPQSIRSNIKFTYVWGRNSSTSFSINNIFNNVTYYPLVKNCPSDWPLEGRTIRLDGKFNF
jgi:outer membrane receptor protein involved in Fe transport